MQVPSEAAPDGGIAVRVFHPGTSEVRHASGAPVVVFVPGRLDAGSLDDDLGDDGADRLGLIVVELVLPGGAASGGTYDYRGPVCQQALADVLRYARGEIADTDGERISDRLPFADPENIGIRAESNGGNLALATLAASDVTVHWLVTVESPVGDQFVAVELGGPGLLNPFYVQGTCDVTTCPVSGEAAALAWDPDARPAMSDPASGDLIELEGQLYLDLDGDGAHTDADFRVATVAGPGPKAYVSTERIGLIDDQSSRLFASWPSWLATPAETEAFWTVRDGSLAYAGIHEKHSRLMVIAVASVRDEAQGQPDHPHVRSLLMGLRDGRTWFRLGADAAYLAAVTGEDAAIFPDNVANKVPPYPGVLDWLLADRFDPSAANAAMLELSDRQRADARDENLGAVLGD